MWPTGWIFRAIIAKLIPTKRELKLWTVNDVTMNGVYNCKAHPDEKGIETPIFYQPPERSPDCKAHPDEKGIETKSGISLSSTLTLRLQSSSRRKGN